MFFISLRFPITLTGSLSPVAFFASGVSSRINTFQVFSSAMVDLPVVQLSVSARFARLSSELHVHDRQHQATMNSPLQRLIIWLNLQSELGASLRVLVSIVHDRV